VRELPERVTTERGRLVECAKKTGNKMFTAEVIDVTETDYINYQFVIEEREWSVMAADRDASRKDEEEKVWSADSRRKDADKERITEKSSKKETGPQVTQERNSRAIAMGASARLDRQAFARLAWCVDVAVRVPVLARFRRCGSCRRGSPPRGEELWNARRRQAIRCSPQRSQRLII
jgi:hypothetical protein